MSLRGNLNGVETDGTSVLVPGLVLYCMVPGIHWNGNTKLPTWVQLPPELVPDRFKHIKDPCVRLYRSLYGHPESGYHWDQRFKAIMKELKAEHLADVFQSTYFIKEK